MLSLAKSIYTSNAAAVPVGIYRMLVPKHFFSLKIIVDIYFLKKIISPVWNEGRWCMSDHTEGDTEMWSSKYVFGNKNNSELKNIYFIMCCCEGLTETDSRVEK